MRGMDRLKLFLIYLILLFRAFWCRIRPRPRGWRWV